MTLPWLVPGAVLGASSRSPEAGPSSRPHAVTIVGQGTRCDDGEHHDGGHDGHHEEPDIRILEWDNVITFANTRPTDTGWVEAMDAAAAQLDTARVVVSTNVPVTVSYSTGSDLHHQLGPGLMELEFAARAKGEGVWDIGCGFHSGSRWTPWTFWRDCDDVRPDTGFVTFEGDQTFGLEVKARCLRQGLADIAGIYTQPQMLTITIAPADGCGGGHH